MTNKELFASMQGQLKPSPQARAALEARLAQPVKKRSAPWKYGAVAACAALVLAAWPIYRVLSPAQRQDLAAGARTAAAAAAARYPELTSPQALEAHLLQSGVRITEEPGTGADA